MMVTLTMRRGSLGMFVDTPLGSAAMRGANGNGAQA